MSIALTSILLSLVSCSGDKSNETNNPSTTPSVVDPDSGQPDSGDPVDPTDPSECEGETTGRRLLRRIIYVVKLYYV